MPRDGAIVFGDLIGKIDVLAVACDKCGRDGHYQVQRLIREIAGVYPMTMKRKPSMIMLICLSAALATPSLAQTRDLLSNDYQIMVPEKGAKRQARSEQPEPWLAPKYKSPLETGEQLRIPKPKTVRPLKSADPGYVYVPQTGRTFQNLPTLPGSGPGGAETSQDRAMRCTHQAGVYGQSGSGSYMGACF